jgi:PKD repeat protein
MVKILTKKRIMKPIMFLIFISCLVSSNYFIIFGQHTEEKQFLGNSIKTSGSDDDNYEENDDFASAYDLSAYEKTWLSTINGYGNQSDDDYYKIYVKPGEERLYVELRFNNSEGDIDIDLYDMDHNLITSSISGSDNEYINFLLKSSGTYFLYIYFGDAGNQYDLWWEDINTILDDQYEENDCYTSAYNLSSYKDTLLSTIKGKGVQFDDDYYEIRLESNFQRLECHLVRDRFKGEMWIHLLDDKSNYYSIPHGYETECIIGGVLPKGTYYVQIYGDNAGIQYDFWWNSTETVADDNYEENDMCGSAKLIPKDSWLSNNMGNGIQLDEDWYQIYVPTGEIYLEVELLFTHESGNLDLILTDQNWNELTRSQSTTDNEFIRYILPSSGTYLIYVMGENIGTEYDLWWNSTVSSLDDSYEENDDFENAQTLPEETYLNTIDGNGIHLDDDYYEITVNPGTEILQVFLIFPFDSGDSYIRLYDENEIFIDSSEGYHNQSINLVNPTNGIYYIRILAYSITGNEYDLWWNSTTLPSDDNYEGSEPYNLLEDTWLHEDNGYGIQLNEDTFEITVDPGYEFLWINLSFIHLEGNLEIYLYDYDTIGSSDTLTDNESIKCCVPSSGTYYLAIIGDNIGTTYDLWWKGFNPPSDDVYEDNENFADAYPLNEDTWLSSISGEGILLDKDIYEIEIQPNYQQLEIYLLYEGEMHISLYNKNEEHIISFSGSSPLFHKRYLESPGKYYITVSGVPSGDKYDLWWNSTKLPPDDNYEENDGTSSAFDFSSQKQEWLSNLDGYGVQLDDDYYEIAVEAGKEFIDLQIRTEDLNGYLYVDLYSKTYGYIDSEYIQDEKEYIYCELPESGNYYIIISGSDEGSIYDLWWDTLSPPTDDNYEENDDSSCPYNLTSNKDSWLSSIDGFGVQNDDDWYEIQITPEDDQLIVWLTSLHDVSDIGLRVYDDQLNIESETYWYMDTRCIQTSTLPSGTYYIQVYGNNEKMDYDLWWNTYSDFENIPPRTASNPKPPKNSSDINVNTNLEVWIHDPDDYLVDVYFYNATDNSIIDYQYSVQSGSIASISLPELSENATYDWYVAVDDREKRVYSEVWTFTTETPSAPESPSGGITSPEEQELDVSFTTNATSINVGESIKFTSAVNNGTSPYTYDWDFNDGSTSNETDPIHNFTTSGTYTVLLTVIDSNSINGTYSRTITVSTPDSPADGDGTTNGIAGYNILMISGITGIISAIFIRKRLLNQEKNN